MTGPTVYIVSHDDDTRNHLQGLLDSVSLPVQAYSDSASFIRSFSDENFGCLLMQPTAPGSAGLALQQDMLEQQITLPTIVIAQAGDVTAAVDAMKNGAVDFIEQPFNDQHLLDCVQTALSQDRARRQAQGYRQSITDRFNTLTSREKEVMVRVVQGMPNRLIAEDLEVSPKTVEVHRSKVMEKMQVGSLSELISVSVTINVLSEFVE